MPIKLIADSCCDMTPELNKQLDITIVPLTIIPATNISFVDDEKIDLAALLAEMKKSKEPTRTACPSIEAYAAEMEKYDECIVITLSKNLSGSYNAARLARETVLEKHPDKKIFIADSKSASAGEVAMAMHARKDIDNGMSFLEVVKSLTEFVEAMDTLFVLEDLSNLVKNGRMSKVEGIVASVMSLHPLLSDDGNGEIKKLKVIRGLQNALDQLVLTIAEMRKDLPAKSHDMVLTYCNCRGRAERLRLNILEKCPAIREVHLVPTRGISTVYANDGGIVCSI